MDDVWVEAIGSYLLVLIAAGRPASTRYLRSYQLRRVAAAVAPVGPWQVTGELLVAWVGGQVWSAETRRSMRSAVRGFYRWAHDTGLIDVDPAKGLPAVRPADPDPRPAPEHAYRTALTLAEDARVRLMLRLAAELGLRRGEVARVAVEDLERGLDGWTLRVLGKGARVRLLPVSDGLAAAVRLSAPVGGGFLFPGRDHGHLSPAYVGRLVARTLPGGWAMHSLRHRFGTRAYEVDRDLLTVQELLGHASPVTTRRYVRVPAGAARRLVDAVARVS